MYRKKNMSSKTYYKEQKLERLNLNVKDIPQITNSLSYKVLFLCILCVKILCRNISVMCKGMHALTDCQIH